VVVLDTEGIGGVDSNAQYDARIFSLALLLCSSLIYNSMGSINEATLTQLSFVAQLSSCIRISNKDDSDRSDDAINFHKIFPSFTWVIRDFALELVDSGQP
jgi:Guanylate-binding protein, N-terminal domain